MEHTNSQIPQFGNIHQSQHAKSPGPKKRKFQINSNFIALLLLFIFVGLLAANLYFTINPPYLRDYNLRQQIIDELSELSTVNVFENPVFDIIKDTELLKSQSDINAEVYKDAQNGDFVVAFNDKLIVYRRDERKIVYEGDTPREKLNKLTREVAQLVIDKAVAEELITLTDDMEAPQLSVIQDVEVVKQQDPIFYNEAREGDIIAVFAQQGVIVLYRQATGEIVNNGSFSMNITN